jgi:hypothetical protein
MPAMQIYGYASLDGVIMTSFLLTLYFFYHLKNYWHWMLAIFFAITSFGLTFGAVWLIPIFLMISVFEHKKISTFVYFVSILLFVGITSTKLVDFNYIKSFQIGRNYEGFRGGYYGFVQPISFLITRIQDILEPLLFYGPYFSLITFLSLKEFGWSKPETRLLISGLISFGIFLLAGAYYTGETARAALYLLPLLIIATTPLIYSQPFSSQLMKKLLLATMIQTLVMQMFGFYYW